MEKSAVVLFPSIYCITPATPSASASIWTRGRVITFGKLLLEGTEPCAGVAHQLLASWKVELEGKRHNFQQLTEWVKKNALLWPTNDEYRPYAQHVAGRDPGTLNILLRFD